MVQASDSLTTLTDDTEKTFMGGSVPDVFSIAGPTLAQLEVFFSSNIQSVS